MKLCKFLLPMFLAISSLGYAQNSAYNLPPGYYLKPNYQVIDLSYKLNGIQLEKEYSADKLRVLKDISEDQLSETSAEYQAYYAEGKAFINSLSSNVKNIYTEIELWYIYAFDKGLRITLESM